MIPRRLITTWICDPARDRYTEAHRAIFARCLTSWLRLMPDYEVTIITLGTLFDHGRDPWVEARVAEGNFIGASQWARLRWLEVLGGIYLDMDVEAITRFDDLLRESCVVGHMGAGKRYANNAVMAAEPGHPFILAQLAALPQCNPASPDFGNESGPYLISDLLRAKGWSGRDENTRVGDVRVMSSRAFHPYPWWQPFTKDCVTPETLAVHHWGQSWHPFAGLKHEGPRPIRMLAGTPIGGNGAHRHGWPFVVDALRSMAFKEGILFDDFVEQSYFWPDSKDRRAKRTQPWIGVFHQPPNMPAYFRPDENHERLWSHPRFVEDRAHLVGAITLSTPLADCLRKKLPHVPVAALRYPTETQVPRWDPNRYDDQPTLAQVGWYLRNPDAIYQAPVPAGVKKLHVRRGGEWELRAEDEMRRLGPFAKRPRIGDTDVVGALGPEPYDDLLTRVVLLAEFVAAGASTTIVESIARGTPILVSPLPAIVEYLGADYPGYFRDLEEIPALLSRETVRAMAEYLARLDRGWLDAGVFVRGVARLVTLASGDAKAEAPTAQMTGIDLKFLAASLIRAERAIEIGCWEGGTTRWMRQHMPGGTLYAVDPWQGLDPSRDGDAAHHRTFAKALREHLEAGRVVEVRRPSTDAFPELQRQLGATVDVVFVDGDHGYEAVREDIAQYRQILRPGGLLCGHDYHRTNFPGVVRAVDEAFGRHVALVDGIWWVRP